MNAFEQSLHKQGIIAKEASTIKLYSDARNIAPTSANILIIGDSGTGKDFLAKYIHQNSPRADKPFIHVNCSAIPADLFESELFGYSAGAFTGSSSSGQKGLAAQASGGTLFLDEIGELDLDLQTKLLMLVQDHKIHTIGASEDTDVDIRIISATNRNLEQMVHDGKFRLDLYYRLNVVSFYVAPLQKRPKDLLAFIEALGQKYEARFQCHKTFTEDALEYLKTRPWNGNIREIQNFMEKLYVLEPAETITQELLKQNYRFLEMTPRSFAVKKEIRPLREAVAEFEKQYIANALKKCSSPEEAAHLLEIDLDFLFRKQL